MLCWCIHFEDSSIVAILDMKMNELLLSLVEMLFLTVGVPDRQCLAAEDPLHLHTQVSDGWEVPVLDPDVHVCLMDKKLIQLHRMS